ncbi:hypothetical protein NQZ68_008860 [Dissostichus eleginoides]|nr:hypothetical protein NQZ68_008860 [Dissostichus eleginoides]
MNSDQPHLTGTKLRQKRQVRSSSSVSANGSNLEWGPHCHYATAKKAYSGSPFALLVNKNNFEILEWKEDSHGSVPKSSVKTCPGGDIYVGKNQYGLGKVATKAKSFYLPWKGKVYKYSKYQVLTITEDIISQEIYDVKYHKDESKMVNFPPEIIGKTSITHKEHNSVEITAPPNHFCSVNIARYKNKVDIPSTALLRRTYSMQRRDPHNGPITALVLLKCGLWSTDVNL